MTISFIGHSFINRDEKIKQAVKNEIQKNYAKGDTITCYLGAHGRFDEICASACKELKNEGLPIERVYVSPYITLAEQAKIDELIKSGAYDTSIYPPIESSPPKFAILKRNEWMIANASLIISFVHHEYGGAYTSLKIAKRMKKTIINVFDCI